METIWMTAKAAIKKRIPGHSYRMWIEPLELKATEEGLIVISTPNYFSKKRIQNQYGSLLEAELRQATGGDCRLLIDVLPRSSVEKKTPIEKKRQMPLPNINVYPHAGRMLRRDFTFDHFVVGGNNDFAYSAAFSLASQKIAQQNALFLLSPTGMGKSHLSQAIGHFVLTQFPSERVYYITSEDFTNEMIYAFRNDSIGKFKEKYRKGCDVLLLEDIHFLTGKERTQIELALTLDCLFNEEKKLIFTSCYLPADIPKIHDQLKSRLLCGLISKIDPPNFKTRVRILKKKSKENGYNVPEDVTHYLAGELSESVRQLESGLIGVSAKSSLLGTPIDLKLAESVVQNISQRNKHITIDVVKKLVCKYYRISVKDLISNSRKQSIVRPRQIAIYLARNYTDQPLQAIGKSFNRYHATALHSIALVEREMKQNNAFREQVKYLRKKLDSGNF